MPGLQRMVVDWSGTPLVGRSCTVLYWEDTALPNPAAVRSAFNALNAHLPAAITITVPNSGDIIQASTGHLSGSWSAPATTPLTLAGAGNCSRGVGGVVGWQTSAIVSGTKGPRRLRGRTFLAPMIEGAFSPSGVLGGGALTAMDAFATALQGAGALAIWHRPTTATSADGSYGLVNGHKINSRVAYLGSRRD